MSVPSELKIHVRKNSKMRNHIKPILKYLIILFLVVLCLNVCALFLEVVFDYTSSQGLKKYFVGFIEPHNIKIKEISCNMHKRSRAGYLLFEIDSEEFAKLKEAIGLLELTEDSIFKRIEYTKFVTYDVIYEIEEAIRRCDLARGFEFKNPQYDENNRYTMTSPFLPEATIYIADPPLPIISSKSCDFIVYNSSTKQCCVLLRYLYG